MPWSTARALTKAMRRVPAPDSGGGAFGCWAAAAPASATVMVARLTASLRTTAIIPIPPQRDPAGLRRCSEESPQPELELPARLGVAERVFRVRPVAEIEAEGTERRDDRGPDAHAPEQPHGVVLPGPAVHVPRVG